MIFTVVRISLLRLWHNRAELLLTFVVPLIFFSIFAWIFGSRDSDGGTPRIKIAVVDLVESEASKDIVKVLEETRSLRIMQNVANTKTNRKTIDLEKQAADSVRRGLVTAAVVLRSETDEAELSSSGNKPANVEAEVFADSYDQVASQILGAVVQKALVTSRQKQMDSLLSRPTNGTQPAVFQADTSLDASAVSQASNVEVDKSKSFELPEVKVRDVLGENQTNPVIAMYAAGIAVMFSLFSTTTSSGSLLEERENSTLERLLCSKLSVDQLLMGKWLYLSCLGFVQITLMFLFGWLVFGVDVLSHLDGFFVMTVTTSAAAASFALMIATACKTRVQLGWLSTIVILVMSALGGSMVPRYLMSESVQRVGMLTFNAWALEGYNKVFWRGLGVRELNQELAVLLGSAFIMLVIARVLISRWERN